MQVIVDNLLTAYSEHGSGQRLVLCLHGWADASASFKQLSDNLIKKNKSLKLVLLDLPGFGGTQAPPTPWGLDDYAKYVSAFLKKIKAEPEVIIGHSNGGAIAIHGLANSTLATDRLILIASAGIREPSLRKRTLRALSTPAKLALNLAPKSSRHIIKRKLYAAIGSDYLIAEHMQETFKKVVGTDVQKDAALLKLPVCLIYGENDKATPVLFGEKLETIIPDAKLSVIPKAGHFVHHEQLYITANIIENFIK